MNKEKYTGIRCRGMEEKKEDKNIIFMEEEKDNMNPKQEEGLKALNEALQKRVDSVEPESITPSLENGRCIPKFIPNKNG